MKKESILQISFLCKAFPRPALALSSPSLGCCLGRMCNTGVQRTLVVGVDCTLHVLFTTSVKYGTSLSVCSASAKQATHTTKALACGLRVLQKTAQERRAVVVSVGCHG